MTTRRPDLDHALATAIAAVAAASFAAALGGAWAWALAVATLAALGLRIDVVPERARPAVRWAAWIAVGITAGLPMLVNLRGLDPGRAAELAFPCGLVLAVLGLFFLLSAPAWSAAATTLPIALALLSAAGLRRDPALLAPFYAVAGLFLCARLGRSWRGRRLWLAAFVAGAALLAVGVGFLLPVAQPWVEARAADLIEPPRTARGGLSLTSRLGDVEELALSHEVVMRAWTDAPRYLRARTYARFDGRSWTTSPMMPSERLRAEDRVPPDVAAWFDAVPGRTWAGPAVRDQGSVLRTRILHDLSTPGVLPAPAGVRYVRLGEVPAWVDAAGVLTLHAGRPSLYALAHGRDAVAVDPPGPDDLWLPPATDPRLRGLAARLGVGSPADRVARTIEHLSTTCSYSLEVGAFRGPDPVAEFVFEKRRGYCEYFASAAALLLRLQGVPARYVVGFAVTPGNLEGDRYVVRESDAHAWAEAYVAGRGWVEVEATPAAQFEAARRRDRGGLLEKLAGAWAEFKALFKQGDLLIALSAYWKPVGVALAAAALVIGWRRRCPKARPRPAAPPGLPSELRALLAAVDRRWAKSGLPRPSGRAPLEHLRGLPGERSDERDAVEVLYLCLYGGAAPDAVRCADLARRLSG
jgi:hypothetical protein